ncbi:MAG: hypothetical protein JEY99_15365 [Spirochaetales bacterium]|nr:hypothetical protein [Spirochaetales bacterium]
MRGVLYTTRVSAKTLKKEQSAKILEIWIEGLQICINENNECFHSKDPRMAFNHFGSLEVPDDFCQSVRRLVDYRSTFESTNARLFSALQKKFEFK